MPPEPKSSKLVLIVDDECSIRTILTHALRLAGYRAAVAESGEEALALFEQRHDRIGLVICDLNLPGISGEQVISELTRIDSAVPVVVATGSGWDPALRKLYPTVVEQLMKPYDLEAVLSVLREHFPDQAQANIPGGEHRLNVERHPVPENAVPPNIRTI